MGNAGTKALLPSGACGGADYVLLTTIPGLAKLWEYLMASYVVLLSTALALFFSQWLGYLPLSQSWEMDEARVNVLFYVSPTVGLYVTCLIM